MAVSSQSRSGGGSGALLLALLVLGLAYANWSLLEMAIDISPVLPEPPAGATSRGPDITVATRLDHKPAAQFPETVTRPLFSPNRLPPVDAEGDNAPAPAAPTPSAEGLRLIGLIKTEEGEMRALIRSADEPFGTWVRVGDDVANWRVTHIDQGKVTVESKGRRFDLNLYSPTGEQSDTGR